MDDWDQRTAETFDSDWPELSLDFHLLGVVGFQQVLDLQRRLVATAIDGQARTVPVLLCEHPNLITVGRRGSRAHIRLTEEQLKRRNLPVEWVARGGGCLVHAPGQLAVYPIVPLEDLGWTVAEYVDRLHRSLLAVVSAMRLPAELRPGTRGVWGRTGLLAALGINVRKGVTSHGLFVNVCPDMSAFGFVDSMPRHEHSTMSSLLAERRGAVRMANVRTTFIECLAQAFGVERYHVHAGHPWLRTQRKAPRGSFDRN
jgi:lipoyl(octanoyl) transferase